MNIESIFSMLKISHLKLSHEKYISLTQAEKINHVSSLVSFFRESLISFTEYLERLFIKEAITINEVVKIEGDFFVWGESVYQVFSDCVEMRYIDEYFFWGILEDELISEYQKPLNSQVEIPKDKLIAYVGRFKSFLEIFPLKSTILRMLNLSPENVLRYYIEDKEDCVEPDKIPSEGVVIVEGKEVLLVYPFYGVAKYLEKMKACSEEKSIKQDVVCRELRLRFETHRIKQWKKINGKVNPVILKVFCFNTRGMVWLKSNVYVI